jgi:hypothetical protein
MPGTIFARDHPVREVTLGINLEATEHRHVDVATADQREGHRAVESACAGKGSDRPSARVRQRRMRHALFGHRPGADQTVFRLEENLDVGRHVIRNERWNSDAKVHQHARVQLGGDAPCDDCLRIHDL